jgi:hypothetical protein
MSGEDLNQGPAEYKSLRLPFGNEAGSGPQVLPPTVKVKDVWNCKFQYIYIWREGVKMYYFTTCNNLLFFECTQVHATMSNPEWMIVPIDFEIGGGKVSDMEQT